MTTREMLRAVAKQIDDGADLDWQQQCNLAAALRAFVARWDDAERDVADRQRALNNSVELGYLRINHGEGEAQHREIELLRTTLARLDTPSPPGGETK